MFNHAPDHLAEFLTILTKRGKAIWLKREIEPEITFCFADSEMIVFQGPYSYTRPADHSITPTVDESEFLPIVAKARNLSFFWPVETPGWKKIKTLIDGARFDTEKAVQLFQQCYDQFLACLDRLGK